MIVKFSARNIREYHIRRGGSAAIIFLIINPCPTFGGSVRLLADASSPSNENDSPNTKNIFVDINRY
jgi:hypothetical protein